MHPRPYLCVPCPAPPCQPPANRTDFPWARPNIRKGVRSGLTGCIGRGAGSKVHAARRERRLGCALVFRANATTTSYLGLGDDGVVNVILDAYARVSGFVRDSCRHVIPAVLPRTPSSLPRGRGGGGHRSVIRLGSSRLADCRSPPDCEWARAIIAGSRPRGRSFARSQSRSPSSESEDSSLA